MMLFTKDVYQQALKDFERPQSELKTYIHLSLDHLCETLNGWNLRDGGRLV